MPSVPKSASATGSPMNMLFEVEKADEKNAGMERVDPENADKDAAREKDEPDRDEGDDHRLKQREEIVVRHLFHYA